MSNPKLFSVDWWHDFFGLSYSNASDEIETKYYELLYAVSNKYPNESRHETALRYIREREESFGGEAKQEING